MEKQDAFVFRASSGRLLATAHATGRFASKLAFLETSGSLLPFIFVLMVGTLDASVALLCYYSSTDKGSAAMVQFGRHLLRSRRGTWWADYYLDYQRLKLVVQTIIEAQIENDDGLLEGRKFHFQGAVAIWGGGDALFSHLQPRRGAWNCSCCC